MQYIIFDLEWNQSDEPGLLSGEIVEIGAVKLDETCRIVDQLRLYVVPKVYPKLHKQVAALTGLRDRDLQEKGLPFPQAYAQFAAWCGEECVWMTWSTSDLPILMENLQLYGLDTMNLPPYCDVQRIFSREIMRTNTQYSLETALAIFKEKGDTAHDALHDARNTAKICNHLDLDAYLWEYTGQVFGIAPHERHYETRCEIMEDPALREFSCPWCGGEVCCERWIHFGHGTHITYGLCPEEDEFLVQLFPLRHGREQESARRIVYQLTDDLWDIYMDKKEADQGVAP